MGAPVSFRVANVEFKHNHKIPYISARRTPRSENVMNEMVLEDEEEKKVFMLMHETQNHLCRNAKTATKFQTYQRYGIWHRPSLDRSSYN